MFTSELYELHGELKGPFSFVLATVSTFDARSEKRPSGLSECFLSLKTRFDEEQEA